MSEAYDTDPLAVHDIQGDVIERLYLWLKGYFDGGTHAVGTDGRPGPVDFPLCLVAFNDIAPAPLRSDGDGDLPEPVARIHCVLSRATNRQEDWTGNGHLVREEQTWNIFVSEEKTGHPLRTGQQTVRSAASLVALLFSHPAPRNELAARHLTNPRVLSGPIPIATTQRSVHQLVVGLKAEWVLGA